MKSVKNILEQGRFEIPDNGFSARVMSAMAQRTSQQVQRHTTLPIRQLSAWREFRLPMIGVAVGILLIGFISSHVLNIGWSWGENYLQKTELLSQQLFSSQNGTQNTKNADKASTAEAENIPLTTDEY